MAILCARRHGWARQLSLERTDRDKAPIDAPRPKSPQ